MKIFFTLFITTATCLWAKAQVPYPPAPPTAGNIVKAEYFFNTDPGLGLGNAITLPASTDIANLTQSLPLNGSALSNGFHLLFIRTMDASGKWSHTNASLFANFVVPPYGTASSLQNIIEAEYFVDTDPRLGLATKIAITPATDINSLTSSLNITGLTSGTHRLYLRTKDASGKWSLTNSALFSNTSTQPYPSASPAAQAIGQLEYFIDTDPGSGLANAVTVTPLTDISAFSVNVPVSNLGSGAHTLYIRSKAALWSHTAYADFNVNTVLPLTWLYVQGTVQQHNAVLAWATAQEVNTDRFLIEHSTDGNNYTAVGEVQAVGNATNNYKFTHQQMAEGFNYYRIKQVDKDGRHYYSKVITLLYKDNLKETVIGPNPAHNSLSIIQPVNGSIQRIEIFSSNGVKVKEQLAASGGQIITMDIQSLPSGSYLVRLTGEQKTESRMFIKE